MNDEGRPAAVVQHEGKESVPAESLAGMLLSEALHAPELELPQVVYDRDGDCIEFLIRNEDFFAERVSPMLTVYIGRESNELVGSYIKGVHSIVKGILAQFPGFKVEVQDGRMRLEHLFTAKLWAGHEGSDDTIHVYLKQLRDVAEQKNLEVPLCGV